MLTLCLDWHKFITFIQKRLTRDTIHTTAAHSTYYKMPSRKAVVIDVLRIDNFGSASENN